MDRNLVNLKTCACIILSTFLFSLLSLLPDNAFSAALVFSDGFESGNYNKWYVVSASESIVSTGCYSGTYCSKTDFSAVQNGKTAIPSPTPTSEFYVSYYIKIDSSYNAPYLGFKWLRLKHGNVDGIQTELYLSSEGWWANGSTYQSGSSIVYHPESKWSWYPSFNDGGWHHVELFVKYNTGGLANGICRIWFDGVLRYDSSTYSWRWGTYSSDLFTKFSIPSNAGDGSHSAKVGDIIYIDDVEIWDGMPDSRWVSVSSKTPSPPNSVSVTGD